MLLIRHEFSVRLCDCFKQGDYGGSGTYDGKLAGIAQFVIGECGSNKPDVYARISYYADWVKRKTGISV